MATAGLAILIMASTGPAAASVRTVAGVARHASAGCSVTSPASPGMTNLLLAAGGDNGAYVQEVPPTYSGHAPMPLVIDLHGYGEAASIQVNISALGAFGTSHGFITITPQVTDTVPQWNTALGSKDIAFIGGLLQRVKATLCVDTNRVFVTGYSEGAFLTSALVCRYASQIAAVAPIAGIQSPKGCHPSRPVPVVAFHGTADPIVSYNGGLSKEALSLPAPDGSKRTLGQYLGPAGIAAKKKGPSIPAFTAEWAARNNCQPHPKDAKVTSDVTSIIYSCPHRADVELYRVTGGGHAWPGSLASKAIESVIGKVTYTISANAIMWKFFQAHPL
jgi:polyhydroxybutyrate depolymerase